MDASAVVDALAQPDGTDALRDRLRHEELHAPSLIDYEVTSAVRGLCLGGHLSEPRGYDVLADFDDLSITRWAGRGPLRRRAFQLRDRLTAYDAAYVALAESLECDLVTRDQRLSRAAGQYPVVVL